MAVPAASSPAGEPAPELYVEEAALRTVLRRFERRSEVLARAHGLTPRQYQLLLQIKGAPDGSERATTTELTKRLQVNQSSVSELVQRALHAGLIERIVSPADGRSWWFVLTDEGSRRLAGVVAQLGTERMELARLLQSLSPER